MIITEIEFGTDGSFVFGTSKCLSNPFENKILESVKKEKKKITPSFVLQPTNSSRLSLWLKEAMIRVRGNVRWLLGRSTSKVARVRVLAFDESITAPGTKR